MDALQFLQPLAPLLSAILLATIADVVLRLVSGARDRVEPLLGIPARMAMRLEAKLNRRERPKAVRASRGIIALIFMVVIGVILGVGALGMTQAAAARGWLIEPLVWFFCFRLTFVWTAGVDIVKQWKKGDKEFLAKAADIFDRRQIPVWAENAKMDKHGVARLVIAAAAVAVHRGWLSAVMWACVAQLCGFSGLVVAVLVVTLSEAERVILRQDGGPKGTGPFAQPFETVSVLIHFVPARVAALVFVLAALFTPRAKPFTALRLMFGQSDGHRSVNDGWPVAAVAGALDVALQTGGGERAWISAKSATAVAGSKDVSRVLWLHGVAVALCVLIFTAVLLLSLAA